MNTDTILFSILRSNNKLILPELGYFITEDMPSQIHPVHHSFDPLSKKIIFVFDASITDSENIFLNMFSNISSKTKAESIGLVKDFISEIKKNLNTSGTHIFENFGALKINSEGQYEFEQKPDLNLNNESYGLASFTSPAIKRDTTEKKLTPSKKRKSKAWLVILIIILFLAGGTASTYFFLPQYFNQGLNFVETQYMTIKDKFIKKEKAVEKKEDTKKTETKTKENKKKNIKDFFGEAINEAIDTLSKTIENDTSIIKNKPEVVVEEKTVTPSDKMYYIVAGSFKSKENAEKYVSELKNKSYSNAYMLPNPKKGFYTVTYNRFSDKVSAEQELKKINAKENSGSWIIFE